MVEYKVDNSRELGMFGVDLFCFLMHFYISKKLNCIWVLSSFYDSKRSKLMFERI